jgi:hypothetical protein
MLAAAWSDASLTVARTHRYTSREIQNKIRMNKQIVTNLFTTADLASPYQAVIRTVIVISQFGAAF